MHHHVWDAPQALEPVDATVAVPGSKSLTNRAIVLAALATSPTRIHHPLLARDTRLMLTALKQLGAANTSGADWVQLEPLPTQQPAREIPIDCGLAGTVMRFVPPIAALTPHTVHFDGDPAARTRPMSGVLDALRALAITLSPADAQTLPLTVHGAGEVAGGHITIDASGSSQFISAMLLVAPRFTHGLTLTHAGGPVPSLPHIEMTTELLKQAGVQVQHEDATWRVEPGPINLGELTIEPDLSNAGPFLAAAMVTGGTVRIPHWPRDTTQPGDAYRTLFERMGARVELVDTPEHPEPTLVLTGPPLGTLRGIEADLSSYGELTPTLVAVAALAPEPSRFTGIAHLRGHETDRLAALTTELHKVGVPAQETADGLDLNPTRDTLRHGAQLASYADHRMATAAAILGLGIGGVTVEDIETTDKTLPLFAQRWDAMLRGVPLQEDLA